MPSAMLANGLGVTAAPARRQQAVAPAAAPSIAAGQRVQVWSNSQKAWLDALVDAVFAADGVSDGYAVSSGTVKVSSDAGTKWILPQDLPTLLRRPSLVPLHKAASSNSSAGSVQLCKHGCGRSVQPGLTRGMKQYDTCCKRCAQNPGGGAHDENCGGARRAPSGQGSCLAAAGADPARSLKDVLEEMLREPGHLERHARGAFAESGGGAERLSEAQVGAGLQLLVAPFGVRLDIEESYLSDACARYGSRSDRSLMELEFAGLCRNVLENRCSLWFPELLPVTTTAFVRQNGLALSEVYRIGEKAGQGSFGSVYRVQHRISGEQRVCKRIAKSQSDMTSEQIMQEIGNMAMLDHPNIIKVYEFFSDAEYVSQIMEPCNGGELQDKVDVLRRTGEAPYDEAFICDVMKQTLRALAFMHNIPFLHKDLKPQNIMLVDDNCSSIKVIDFGLAELFNRDQRYAHFVGGTLLYMAPEVFCQKMTVKVDVWSAGVILFNLLTGDFPFIAQWPPPDGLDEAWWQDQTIQKICDDEPKRHPAFRKASPACVDLLMQMLRKDDSARPDAAQCLEHPWFSKHSEVPPTLSVGVVQCVEAYARMSELKKAVFLLIAHQCEVEALHELRALFTHFDVRNCGQLSTKDLRQVLAESGMGPLSAERVLHALDRNRDGQVSWTEFTAAAICVSVCRKPHVVDAAFATFDTDRDGKISVEDVKRVFADRESTEAWQSRLPELFSEVVQESSGKHPRPVTDALRSLARAAFRKQVQASTEQFRNYIGHKLDFRAGDALYPVI